MNSPYDFQDNPPAATYGEWLNNQEQLAKSEERFLNSLGRSREDATYTAAVNICGNCGRTCNTLIKMLALDFAGCETCVDEAMAAEEKPQAKPARRQSSQKLSEVA